MKHGLTLVLGSLALAFSMQLATAADADPAKPKAKARPVATAKWSMAEKGSFHKLHAKSQKLDCEDCHEKAGLPDDTLKLRLHEAVDKDGPGPVDTANCHECHG